MPGKKFWRKNARAVTKLLKKEEKFNDKANDQIGELSLAVAEALVIFVPAIDGQTSKKQMSIIAADWYSKFSYLVPEDEETELEEWPNGDSGLLPADVHPGMGNYDSTDDLTLYGVPVRVRDNPDNGFYHLIRRDSGLPANAEDDPVPADQLKWRGKWNVED